MDFATLLSTYGLLLVAELGDKTQLAVITQTCKYRRPWPVSAGAALALAAITGLGVAFGRLLGALVPAQLMQRIAAAGFVAMGLYILYELYRRRGQAADADCPGDDGEAAPARRLDWLAFSSTFALLFVAELGDKTQLAALSLATSTPAPWAVFVGGALALATTSALAVLCGRGLCLLIPERTLKLISAAAFIVLGVLVWIGVF